MVRGLLVLAACWTLLLLAWVGFGMAFSMLTAANTFENLLGASLAVLVTAFGASTATLIFKEIADWRTK